MVLLVTAGLMVRSVQSVYAIDPGFGHEPTAILSVAVPDNRYSPAERAALVAELRERFAALPSVQAVGLITNLHLNQTSTEILDVAVEGVAPPPGYDFHTVDWATANAGFFAAAGIQLLEGRNFDARDGADARPVAIVSRAFAQRFYPDGGPLGRTFSDADGAVYEVMGVTSDTKVRTFSEATRPFVYVAQTQDNPRYMTFIARTARDPEATAAAMLRSLRERAPALMVQQTKTMAEHLDVVRFPLRLAAMAVGAFAALALALAAVGLFGLVSYAQAQRAREVGIRMALGAEASSVVGLLLRSGLKLVAVGGVLGLLGAVGVARLLGSLLVGVETIDPVTFLATPLLLFATALLASWLPARRASRVDPVVALRTE